VLLAAAPLSQSAAFHNPVRNGAADNSSRRRLIVSIDQDALPMAVVGVVDDEAVAPE